MKKLRILAIFLMILGITIFVFLSVYQTIHSYRLWSSTESWKAEEFPTFIGYWWNFNKGLMLVAFLLGSIPCSIGYRILKKTSVSREKRC